MAITRRVHREINLVNSRGLRSGALLPASPAIRPPIHRLGHTRKLGARRSPTYPGRVRVRTAAEQSQQPEDGQHDSNVPSTPHVTDRIQEELPMIESSECVTCIHPIKCYTSY
jgi:hypothetical protein